VHTFSRSTLGVFWQGMNSGWNWWSGIETRLSTVLHQMLTERLGDDDNIWKLDPGPLSLNTR